MRLSDILSKAPQKEFVQIDGFLVNKKGNMGQQVSLSVGNVMLNYFCSRCDDVRTFTSRGNICCVFANKQIVSIDCVMTCGCGTSVQVWFLVESDDDICGQTPRVRILKRSERLSDLVKINDAKYGDFSELLEKSGRANRDQLGAGAMVYLRKIFEQITLKTAKAAEISTTNVKGKRKTFKDLLKEVDNQCSIIPREFSENGYMLFSELSEIVHGEYNEELALLKYESLHRLIVGVLDNVKNNEELMNAIGSLGWNDGGESQ
ncbi:hypothetical protein [Anaerobium acetethylicum]|uniref:Uncharacterized protein n=1 Tax=Anaerobium acetethylicum TaxID=1619234 RepID=A0A1D3TYK9_9FIRM|nr:hypothetical protein [Anaerobium acetethylicum]SCP99558.1 hypothetical protein SAMN05421730_10468 [Anaerobium acetethylicum]